MNYTKNEKAIIEFMQENIYPKKEELIKKKKEDIVKYIIGKIENLHILVF